MSPSDAPDPKANRRPRLDRSEVTSVAMPMGRAQALSLGAVGLFGLLSLLPHWLIWGGVSGTGGEASPVALLLIGVLLVACVVLHEALHGLGYWWGGADRSEIEFGFNWEGLAPYAHCTAALRCGPYRRAVALPGLVLGGPPLAIGLATGHWGTTLFAFVMLAFAGGDALLLWTLRGVAGTDWVRDHPSKMGALVLGHGASETAPSLAFDLQEDERESDSSPRRALLWLLGVLVVSMFVGLAAGFLIGRT